MLRYVVIALIVIPALELIVIFQMGKLIGGWPTFGLMIVTGFLGAWLARREGSRCGGRHRISFLWASLPGIRLWTEYVCLPEEYCC